jgi:GT2 family glycosyltransferase
MRVSVVVVTYNRRESLLRCLAAISRLDYADYEVVVVDDGSTDGTSAALAERFPAFRCLTQPANAGEPSARNVGVRAAAGDLIAFTDDDCVPPPDWLRRHVSHYDDPRIAAVGGPQVSRTPNFFDAFHTVAYGVKFRGRETIADVRDFRHLVTGNMSVRRSVFDVVGPFDARFLSGCDSDFVRRLSRAGFHFVRDPEIEVDHFKVHDLGSYLRMRFHRGCGSVLTDMKEGTLQLRRFVPFVDPRGAVEQWRDFRKSYGGGARSFASFWTLTIIARLVEVAGRGYYYWRTLRRPT